MTPQQVKEARVAVQNISWPVHASMHVNISEGTKIENICVSDASNMNVVVACVKQNEAQLLAHVLNYMHETIENQSATILEKNQQIVELVEIKQKYYELLKKQECEEVRELAKATEVTNAEPMPENHAATEAVIDRLVGTDRGSLHDRENYPNKDEINKSRWS